MTFGWLFLVIFPIGNEGGTNWRRRILENQRRARWQERAWGIEERRELHGPVVQAGGEKKKDGPGKQDQQMAALNTWDDSITDKSQEEVAAGCRSTKRPDRAALDDLRGPSLPRSLCGPTGPWTSMQTSVEKRKERKIPSTGSAINLNCVIPSTYCRPRWNPNEKSTIKTRQKKKKS